MITFKGTAAASMQNIVDQLHTAATSEEEQAGDAAFQDAMLSVINLAVVTHRGDQPARDGLARFRQHVGDLLAQEENRGNLGAYIADTDTYASRAVEPGAYYQAALARTAVQLLLDDYPAVSDWLPQPLREELADTDEALREAAEEVPPLESEAIPKGLPESHWWWRAPHGDPDTYALLYAHHDEDL